MPSHERYLPVEFWNFVMQKSWISCSYNCFMDKYKFSAPLLFHSYVYSYCMRHILMRLDLLWGRDFKACFVIYRVCAHRSHLSERNKSSFRGWVAVKWSWSVSATIPVWTQLVRLAQWFSDLLDPGDPRFRDGLVFTLGVNVEPAKKTLKLTRLVIDC